MDNSDFFTNENYVEDVDNIFDDYQSLSNEPFSSSSSITFGAGSEKSLEFDLKQAQKNVDYYQREISNFSEFTSETYKRNCISHLERALERVEYISDKLEKIQSEK